MMTLEEEKLLDDLLELESGLTGTERQKDILTRIAERLL